MNIKRKHIKFGGFIDALIILLNLAAGRGNYLLFWLLRLEKTTWVVGIVIIIDLIYLFLRNNKSGMPRLKYSPFVLIIAMLTYNWFNIFLRGLGNAIITFEFLALWVLFTLIVMRQISILLRSGDEINYGIRYLSKGYVVLSLLSVLGIFITFIALQMGLGGIGRILEVDYMNENIGSSALYQWHILSIVNTNSILRVPFFQDFGILTGLYHEPNAVDYHLFPCLILCFGLAQRSVWRILIIIIAVLLMLFTGSATNILVVGVCLLMFSVIKLRSSPLGAIALVIAIVGFVYYYIVNSDGTFVDFLMGRFDTDNASRQYSVSMLEYTFTPKSFFGYDFLSTAFMKKSNFKEDIGYIPFIFTCIFLTLYLRNVIRLIMSKDRLSLAVGFASLYFILHSAKLGLSLFYQTLPILLIIMQIYILNHNGRIGSAQRNKI